MNCNFYKIVSYDSETEHFVELKKMDRWKFDIIPYMKSSVSLKALGEKEAIQVLKAEEENETQTQNKKKKKKKKKKKRRRRTKKRNKFGLIVYN